MASISGPPGVGMNDLMLRGLPSGKDIDDAIGNALSRRARGATSSRLGAGADISSATMTWASLQGRHPAWDLPYWEECRALYAGGKCLFGNAKVFERLFPKTKYEPAELYGERKSRAFYFPYAGTIIDSLVAGLSSDPLRISFGTMDAETGQLNRAAAAEWWEDFVEDVSNEAYSGAVDADQEGNDEDEEGGEPMHHFIVEIIRECMQTGLSWVRCDLPMMPDDAPPPTSMLDAERAGVNSPYLCRVPAEQVIDWEFDSSGKILQWVLTLEKSTPRPSPLVQRSTKIQHHHYELWTQGDFTCFDIDVDTTTPPNDATPIHGVTRSHDFGRVPFEAIVLPDGLWAMNKLHTLAREHLNKRCAMSWAEFKSLFAVLYEFLNDEDSGGSDLPVVDDPNRATSQVRAQGYTQMRRKGDTAEYIGPDVAPYKEARESCNDTMREMHRVMFSMALSANMDKAALSRSGDSKEKDEASTKVLLAALGLLVRRYARRLLALVSTGRSEAVPPTLIAGLEHFDVSGVTSAITDAVSLYSGGVPILSKTFNGLYLLSLYRKLLGDTATDEQISQIRDEIDEGIAAEELMKDALNEQMLTTPPTEDGGPPPGNDDEEGDSPPPKPAPKPSEPASRPIRSKPMKK
jgi:hypothetical protein